MSRPVLAAVESQQKKINRLEQVIAAQHKQIVIQGSQLAYLARVAGVQQAFASIQKKADENNPGSPIPDPPSEAPAETTEQARTPEASDDPRNPGQTPGSVDNLAAGTTTTPLVPGEAWPTSPYNDLQDATAPVSGTETQRPLNETKIETDVRVGDPTNPQVAFPWTLSSLSADERAERTMASMRLANLRIAAAVARGDVLEVAASIESDESITPQMLNHEIATLSAVTKAAGSQQGRRPAGLVPQASRTSGVQRTVPSMTGESGLTATAGIESVSEDTQDSDLFD